MITSQVIDNKAERYWMYIKDAPLEVKFKLIGLLTDSLSRLISQKDEMKDKDKNIILDELCGSWNGPESAADIIDVIRENRTSRPPVTF